MKPDLKKDFPSSIAVALVAIPLCLGIAQASGAPLLAGLVSGIVGGVVVGKLSASQLSVTGPAAGLTTIVLAGLAKVGGFPQMLTATVLAGLLQMVLGKLRAGSLSRLFPSPVIKGMLAAIGITLIMKQFPHLVGFDVERFGVMEFSDTPEDVDPSASPATGGSVNTLTLIARAFSHIEPTACSIGLLCLGLLYFWEARYQKRFPTLPGSLVAVAFGVVANLLVAMAAPGHALDPSHLVQIPPLSTGFLTFPDWSALANPAVWSLALTLGVIASVESLLTVEALDRLDPKHRFTPPNQELLAQGAGNLVCGLIGGLPVTSVVVRGTVNLSAGASSKWSTILHGCWLLMALLVFRVGLNQIPLASLAAILVHVGIKMAHPSLLKKMMGRGYAQGIPYIATIIAVMFTDLLIGILIGTIVATGFILRNLHISKGYHVIEHGKTVHIRFHQEVTFLHKVRLSRFLETLPAGSFVEFDGTGTRGMDADVIDVIETFCTRAPQRNIHVIVGGIPTLATFSEDQKTQMQAEYERLLENNRSWVEECSAKDPAFFEKMAHAHKPMFLFIGCSDCRVPAVAMTKTEPGQLFVHRNVANIVSPHDMNIMSVLQYSIDHLNVPHIIVCGHYGCSGVRTALSQDSFGLIDNWVHPIKRVVEANTEELAKIADPYERECRVVELHVMQQMRNVLNTAVVQKSIRRLGIPQIHGWVYDSSTGRIKDLREQFTLDHDTHPVYHFHYSFSPGSGGGGIQSINGSKEPAAEPVNKA